MTSSAMTPFKLPAPVSDGLNLARGLSAQLVLFGHAISFLAIFPALQPPSIPYLQNIGVVVFFFISGVVIAHTIETKTASYPVFLFDRATRIFTALIPALLFVAAIDWFFMNDPHYAAYAETLSLQNFIGNIALLANYPTFRIAGYPVPLTTVIEALGTLRPIWTVILECWLYVFFGYLFLYRTIESRALNVAFAVLFAFSVPPALVAGLDGRGGGLTFVWLVGAIYYRLVLRTDLLKDKLPIILIGLASALLMLKYGRPLMAASGYDLRYSLVICVTSAFLIEVYRRVEAPAPIRNAVHRLGSFLASYSFSLYLVHYTILAPIPIWLDAAPRSLMEKLVALAVLFTASNLVAYVFFFLFESRYRAVRQFLSRYLSRPQEQSTQGGVQRSET